jgi:hypothetical protein
MKAMTRLLRDVGKPGRLTSTAPWNLRTDGVNWPDMLWLSAGPQGRRGNEFLILFIDRDMGMGNVSQ